jgi:hypothetical protein
MPRYALHGGSVISANDGEEHYISPTQLIQLYRLKPGEYCLWIPSNSLGRVWEDYIHLYPRTDGNYHRPDEDV